MILLLLLRVHSRWYFYISVKSVYITILCCVMHLFQMSREVSQLTTGDCLKYLTQFTYKMLRTLSMAFLI